jgi:hypothetical protein
MSLKRKLAAALAILMIAGGATGAALAARGHANATVAPRLVQGRSLLGTASAYLGVSLPQLKSELHPGHPLAAIAGTTPGRTVAGLRAALYHDANANLRKVEATMSPARMAYVRGWLHKKIAGFVAGTCPLKLGGLFIKLGGSCPGMSM